MSKAHPDERDREFHFTNKEFDFLRDLVAKHAGIVLSENKFELVYGRLSKRIRILKLNTFAEYCNHLTAPGSNELPEFLNAITTNLTAFFRENHHFEFLTKTLFPEIVKRNKNKVVQIWSAGCSTGEEPYSIAMTALEFFPKDWTIKIFATDLDSEVLSTAKNGIYKTKSIESVPPDRLKRWFFKGKGKNSEMAKVSPELQEIITFHQLNLMEKWPMKTQFDLMFCRNVIIYFNKDTQRKLIDRYADQLVDGACLFIGHSESLFRVSERFEKIESTNTTYRKIS